MDEAEALCDKIAIMVDGRFVCIGTPGELKEQFGQGYQAYITSEKSSSDSEVMAALPFLKVISQASYHDYQWNTLFEF